MEGQQATRASWQNEPMPSMKVRLEIQRAYSHEEFAVIARGIIPAVMEDKWFIFLEDNRLYLCRSWTGYCVFEVRFDALSGQHAIAEAWVNRDPSQYGSTDDQHDTALLLYLLDHVLLGHDIGFPQRSDLNVTQNTLYQWSQVGRAMFGRAWPSVESADAGPR